MAWKWKFGKAADFYLIAGKPEKAKEMLKLGVHTFKVEKYADNDHELPTLEARLIRT